MGLGPVLILLSTRFIYYFRAASAAGTTDQGDEMKDELLQIRRVIDGRVYDTTTAALVHRLTADEGSIKLNFHVDRTALYRTRNGRFFIAGESGALGRWGRRDDNSYVPGRGLKLITDLEARLHLEETHGPVEEFFDIAEG
jgi:hypothetical protein